MKTAVRYYSCSGNVKAMAEAFAKAAGTEAISVDQEAAKLKETVDILFVGGALYAYGIDEHLKNYLNSLRKDDVKKAALFSSSWISKHAFDLMRKILEEKGIDVAEETCYVRGRPNEEALKKIGSFAKGWLDA